MSDAKSHQPQPRSGRCPDYQHVLFFQFLLGTGVTTVLRQVLLHRLYMGLYTKQRTVDFLL